MSFLDELKKFRQADNTLLHEVLLNIGTTGRRLHVFFEGKTDESFYGQVLEKHEDVFEIVTYKSGNKKSVYYFWENLRHRSNHLNKFAFFVDKDLDDLIPVSYPAVPEVHVTKHYSIENYLVSTKLYGRIVSEFFRTGRGNGMYLKLMQKYDLEYENYCKGMLGIMAWILFQKRHSPGVIVQNIKNSMLVSVDSDLTVTVPPVDSLISELDRLTKVTTDLSLWKLERPKLEEELLAHPPKSVVRGKFELYFFVQYCKETKKVIEKVNGASVLSSITFDTTNAIDIFSSKIALPSSFNETILAVI